MPIQLERLAFVIGIILMFVTIYMLAPMMADYAAGNDDWKAFAHAFAISGILAGLTIMVTRDHWSRTGISLREGFMITAVSWFVIPIAGSLPFYFMEAGPGFIDAWFEAVSGMTTTGSTVLQGLDHKPPGILLWRSILQWIGGVGIVLMAMIILPFLRVGGMQIFSTESSDRSEKLLPRDSTLIVQIAGAFVVLTLACMVCYRLAGMSTFDAVNHALTTIATGGYSTHDTSLGYYKQPAIHWVATVFMVAASLPIILYIKSSKAHSFAIFRDVQVRGFLKICVVAIFAVTLYLVLAHKYAPSDALRVAAFNVVSIISTTGFALDDFTVWGPASNGMFLVLMFLGGCTGSTAGGIKTYRLQAMAQITKRYINMLFSPNRVIIMRYGTHAITNDIVLSILAFVTAFAGSIVLVMLALTVFGLDILTAFSGAVTALANVGPGLGDVIGPSGNFKSIDDGAKVVLIFAMILGRLEFFAFLVLLSPSFWR